MNNYRVSFLVETLKHVYTYSNIHVSRKNAHEMEKDIVYMIYKKYGRSEKTGKLQLFKIIDLDINFLGEIPGKGAK